MDHFIPQVQPVDVPRVPIPLDFLWRSPEFDEQDLARLAIAFRDSFQKCLRARGDVALDTLRQAVLQLLKSQVSSISLQDIYDCYETVCSAAGRDMGSIGAKLSEIISLSMISPDRPPADLFSQRWVISFGSASDEPKRLAIFLLLDALNSFLMSLPDSDTDEMGRRAMRLMLVIDEAREILSYRHGALSSLIRRSASKGAVIMLLSQGPDDFDQEEDDFLQQMGTVGVFALSASNLKSLSGTFGKKPRLEEFSDRALPRGVALVKLPEQSARKILAWR